MKKYFFSIVCLCTGVVMLSCSKDKKTENNGNGSGNTSMVTSINAKVENGAAYNSVIDSVEALMYYSLNDGVCRMYPLTSSPYINEGFTLNLPKTVDSKYLSTWELEGTTVSDTNAKVGYIDWFEAYKFGVKVGEFYYASAPWNEKDELAIYTDAQYMYADRDVNITGTFYYLYGDKENYHVYLKKGWNIIYSTWSESTETYDCTGTITTTAVNGLKWYFYESDNESYKMKKTIRTSRKQKSMLGFDSCLNRM